LPLVRRERDNYDLSDFIPEVLDIYTIDGKVYGLPMLITGSFIFYHRDLFDAAGLKYPPTDWDDISWTHDAFVEKCGQLTSNTDDPEIAVFGCNLGFWPNDTYAWLYGQDLYPDSTYQTGFASETYLDSDAAVETVEEFIANSQVYQANLVQFATESYRGAKYDPMQGIFHFMFVDDWPSITWSVLDCDRQPKAGFYALQTAVQPVLPSINATLPERLDGRRWVYSCRPPDDRLVGG